MNAWLSALPQAIAKKPGLLFLAVVGLIVSIAIRNTGWPTLLIAVIWAGTFYVSISFVFAWARLAGAGQFMQSYTTRDIVVMAMLIAVGGVFKAYWGQARLLLESLFGPYAVFVIGPGFYMWGVLACILVRKPLSGTISMVLGGVVEILAGNPFGLPVLLFNFWEGFGPDVAYQGIFRGKRYDWFPGMVGGWLSALFGLWYGWIYFGFSQLPFWAFLVYLFEVFLAGVFGGLAGYALARGLERIGVKQPAPAVIES